jgi:hypothetical protein
MSEHQDARHDDEEGPSQPLNVDIDHLSDEDQHTQHYQQEAG